MVSASPRQCSGTAQGIALTSFLPVRQSPSQGRKEKVKPKPFFKLLLSPCTHKLWNQGCDFSWEFGFLASKYHIPNRHLVEKQKTNNLIKKKTKINSNGATLVSTKERDLWHDLKQPWWENLLLLNCLLYYTFTRGMNYLKHNKTALLCLQVIHSTQSKQLSVKVDLSLILCKAQI